MNIKRILVIDDDDDIRNLVQTCLELIGGWQVLSADSGQAGLLKAKTDRPGAILLDVMMPGMDGLTTLQQLRADATTQNIPVILLTAKGQSLQQSQLIELNVQGRINKPFNARDLVKQVMLLLSEDSE
ncbi:response regulator [Pseudanabaenaceae cyanobacterium LEGE 13415]|nr:response regulator [Pseudanabaenaceae cyanobacterium LEGE 13415]